MGNSCVGDSRPLAEDGRVISEPVCVDSAKPEAIADMDPEIFAQPPELSGHDREGPEPPAREATEDASGSYVAPATISRIVGDGICAICLEPLRNQAQTIAMCGHIFHRDCINKCGSAFCPQCRHLIDRPAGAEGRSEAGGVHTGFDDPLTAGVRVVLCGLHALVVQHLSDSDGHCYTVRTVEGSQLFRVHEDNLLVMAPSDTDTAARSTARSSSAPPASASGATLSRDSGESSAGFQPGTVVELCGLQVAQQFNGQMAEILSNYTAHGRHEVRLLSDGSIKVVRNENLRLPISSTATPSWGPSNAGSGMPSSSNGVMTVNEFIAHAKRCRRRGVEVTKLELTAWARYLGIDPTQHPDLAWIAYEALKAPLPPEWSEHYDSDGRVYYFNMTSRVSSWTHPLEQAHRYVYQRLARCRNADLSDAQRGQEVGHVQQWCEEAVKEAERELMVWTEHADERGDRFYFNREQRRSNWGNPRPALLHVMYLHKNAHKVLASSSGASGSPTRTSEIHEDIDEEDEGAEDADHGGSGDHAAAIPQFETQPRAADAIAMQDGGRAAPGPGGSSTSAPSSESHPQDATAQSSGAEAAVAAVSSRADSSEEAGVTRSPSFTKASL
eukprot:CAMPEP_0178463926 /NCGR_PEP_ID=MMETSP0689_2-20121128/50583_1 /TAXON_ID=160604 /ORGANISM="Amphidinium massartii, Strain CS-259" /LENGTH=613 /DNA_ID=CAMNT_0020090821 /DNA_START=31 /DNA_END=1872 /DNA_ORIENTATION=+